MRYKRTYFLFFLLSCLNAFSQFQSGEGTVNTGENRHQAPPAPTKTDPEINRIISIVNTVEENSNFIDRLLPDSNLSLPFGIIKQIGEARYVIAIDSASFEKQGAYFSAYAAIDFPGTTSKMALAKTLIKLVKATWLKFQAD